MKSGSPIKIKLRNLQRSYQVWFNSHLWRLLWGILVQSFSISSKAHHQACAALSVSLGEKRRYHGNNALNLRTRQRFGPTYAMAQSASWHCVQSCGVWLENRADTGEQRDILQPNESQKRTSRADAVSIEASTCAFSSPQPQPATLHVMCVGNRKWLCPHWRIQDPSVIVTERRCDDIGLKLLHPQFQVRDSFVWQHFDKHRYRIFAPSQDNVFQVLVIVTDV